MRIRLVAALLPIVALGIGSKLYRGPAEAWVRFDAGGVLYVVFWVLGILAIRPSLSPARVAVWVVGVTAVIECSQLWHPAALEAVRSTFVGQALIGDTFAWWDFPHYALGGLLALGLVRALTPR